MTTTIWIHGAALHGGTWQPPPIGRHVDLPGHRQAPLISDPSVERYADTLIPGLPDQFTLVGHSLGAMVAMDIGSRLPDRCKALVLVDPPLRMPLWMLRRYGPIFARIASKVPGPKGIAAMMALRVERPSGRPMVKAAIGSMSALGLRDAMIAAAGFDGRDLLGKLTMPTLAILGKRSVLTGPRTAKTLRRDLPMGTVEIWDTGHMIPFDKPEAFYDRTRLFLSQPDQAQSDQAQSN